MMMVLFSMMKLSPESFEISMEAPELFLRVCEFGLTVFRNSSGDSLKPH
jgi:hypothetical protein